MKLIFNLTKSDKIVIKIVLLIAIVLFFSSCLGTKKASEYTNTSKEVDKSEIVKDSSNITKTNEAINDRVVTQVASSDPITDAKIDEILSKLNTKKSSGSNGYDFSYDPKNRQLIGSFTVGPTTNSKITSNSDTNTEKTVETQIDEYIYKKITTLPWWAYLVIAFLLRNQILGILSFFIPGLKGVTTLVGLKNKLTPKIRSPVQ